MHLNSATVKYETASPSKMPRIYESTHLENHPIEDTSYHYTVQQKRSVNSKINFMMPTQTKSRAMKQSLASNMQIVSRNNVASHQQNSTKIEKSNAIDRPNSFGQPTNNMNNTKSQVVGNVI